MNPLSSDKILHHLPKVVAWLNDRNPFVITIELDATNICNHKCPGCCGFAVPDKESLSIVEMKSVISEVQMLGGKGIIFTGGGEPLCNVDTVEAIKYADLCGLDVGLITNGGLLHKSDMNTLLDCCKWIRISLDAGSERMHKRTHGSSDFKRILMSVDKLTGIKNDDNYKCTIGTAYLTGLGTDALEDMMNFVNTSISLGVDYAQFRPFLSYGKQDLHKFKPIDFEPLIGKSNNTTSIITSEYKYNLIFSENIEKRYKVCYGQQFATVVCANGDVTICCHTRGNKNMTIGSIKDNGLNHIWNSKKRREVVNSIDLDRCPDLCRCDPFNEILWNIKEDCRHVNFL